MTTIRVKPEELETVAKHVPDAEDACQRARTSLSWELPSLVMEIPGIGSAAIHELTDELIHWLDRYEEKLNEAEELLYRTAAAIRQADQTLADNIKEFGLELSGLYDLQRLFGEYDPVTGERISVWDRLVAGGMLLASFIPPVKGAGIAGKAGIKGAKAAGIAADVSKLVPQMKYVLRYDKMMSVFQAAYLQVVKAPITKTLQYFKKQWNDLLASVSSVQWQPALAGIGPASRAWMSKAKEEVKETAMNRIGKTGDEVAGKGKGKANFVNIASKKRTKHILYGDKTGGGHLWPGTGNPNKTLFPKNWSAERVMHNVSDIATDPTLKWKRGRVVKSVQRYEVIGIRDGIKIKVITDGKDIITAFPIK
ncbi:pre-toxin TG domain-containing protein [Parageobacillus thermoglucosidasius]|uniref:Pre-toxin TG domain-containing protein n=4 Tax=Anoxybacillaceae TaxID=3120669 RepID=A0AAN0YSW4_PARTM|nr:pre-toxin TG domain-containing protein [Parageobacillus thermoglucosidasius]AEH48342.1 hypothetical protein Geoth_2426 [Parageobacillus thermoglucosidasius C56-YS93]ALF10417.1 hypothetical protein AOT13_10545 [Parageobacillus thermoglucosidasius]ANZ30498.1 hypothetical protein BCV53_10560 [Parageobacillus thermoglucosidasius]APM81236.1 hypothetical protein BCV54_10570 [Parageobacillus thermoglucosidasius]KJX68642.1 hypothetical protein WH82_11645 [Parageobacillus thermoglucosidasius]